MKVFPLQARFPRFPRFRRPRAARAGMALALAAAAVCTVAAPNVLAAGNDAAAASSASGSSTGAAIRDTAITAKAKAELAGASDLSAGDIHVKTRHGVVTLTGSVPHEQQRTQAVDIVRKIDGVQDVRDQLTIRPK
ncbi:MULTISPECIES: BON domain-containing protein [Burkholderia]|uniref:BON domain-containing protein n=1 Tax=Burkholderia TaxID=32008 RepID=UPI0008418506|nr:MULTISPECIES: BON domain-containing protein [unclassified Burkholderia]AOK31837.1 transporter [Burkholderia sp. Bp7605]